MKILPEYIILAVSSFFIMKSSPVISQELTSASGYYSKARTLISADSIQQASLLVDTALKYYTDNYDLLMLSARMEAWKGNYQGSISLLNHVKKNYPMNREILKLQADIYYWQNNFDSLLVYCNKYINQYSADPDISFKKALALNGTGQTEESIKILESLIQNDQETVNAKKLLQELKNKNTNHRISAQYLFSFFDDDNRTPWQNLRLGYGFEGKTGAYNMYLSGGRMYDAYYQQIETDIYLTITEWMRSRIYGNYTFQPVTLHWFYGGELFFKLPASFEISGGVQQLTYTDVDFSVITGQLIKYLNDNYLSLRSSIYLNNTINTNYAVLLQYRRYFENNQWIGISTGYGYLFNDHSQSDINYQAHSTGVNLEYNMQLFRNHYLKWMAGYQQENPDELPSRSMYTFFVEYKFMF